jgi:Lar family restriction alleviation protein
MMDKLLPCPFCGGEQAIKARYIGYGSLGLGGHDEYRVVCKECRASSDEYKSEAKAIAAWNSRTGKDINVATNADRIRSMSDEELAEFLRNIRDCGDYEELKFMGGVCMDYVSVIEWLKQPAKEE